MAYILFCRLAKNVEEKRREQRGAHLQYIGAHRTAVIAGGPTLHDDGTPDTMIIALNVDELDEAEAFIAYEPYNRNGVFSEVTFQKWARVLPEICAGALDRAIADELGGEPAGAPRAAP